MLYRLLVIGLMVVPGVWAQLIQRPQNPPDVSGELDRLRPSYQLVVGDQLTIRATDVEEIVDKPYKIDTDGTVALPLLGRVEAAGLTIEQFEARLVNLLKPSFKNPKVTVTVAQYRSEPVFFVGPFKAPGLYALQGRRTLLEMLTLAGGLQANASRRIRIVRRKDAGSLVLPNAQDDPSGKTVSTEMNLGSLRESIGPADDIPLQQYDVILAERSAVVYVTGEVGKTGGLELDEREYITVTQALTLVGGLTRDASKQVRVLRPVMDSMRRGEISLDVAKIFKGEANDFPLMPNDILVVPRAGKRAFWTRSASLGIPLTIPMITGLAISGR